MFLLVHSNTLVCVGPSNSGWLLSYVNLLPNSLHITATSLAHTTQHAKNMVKIVLVGFLPQDNGHSCEAHPYGSGNALLEQQRNGVG